MHDSTDYNQYSITPDEYNKFCKFLVKESGIQLGTDKTYLLSNRLYSFMSENHIATITELLNLLQTNRNENVKAAVVDAMTTNETNWFRDMHPFSILKHRIFPELAHKANIRIWSAGCSTGQEPYSISLSVSEFSQQSGNASFANKVQILATDLSTAVVNKAKAGEYSLMDMERGVDKFRLNQFFSSLGVDKIQIKPTEKSRVTFKVFNLLNSFAQVGKFDIIFCRNVLIYFDQEAKIKIINKYADALNANGYLMLGSSEIVPPQCMSQFKMINCSPGIVYRKTT